MNRLTAAILKNFLPKQLSGGSGEEGVPPPLLINDPIRRVKTSRGQSVLRRYADDKREGGGTLYHIKMRQTPPGRIAVKRRLNARAVIAYRTKHFQTHSIERPLEYNSIKTTHHRGQTKYDEGVILRTWYTV